MVSKVQKIYKELPIQVKASGWFFVCSLIQKAISVISTMIFTRIISTEDYGIISIYNSWSDILYIVATLNLATGVYNVGMTRFSDKKDEFNSSLQMLALVWTGGFSLIFLFMYKYIKNVIHLSPMLVYVMLITFLVLPAYYLWSAKQRYENKYKALVIVTVTYAVTILVVSLLAILNASNKSEAKIVSNAIVTLAFGGALFCRNLWFRGPKVEKKYVVFALKFNIPMIPAFLSMVVLNQIDRIMISNQVSLSKAGIYSVAYSAAMFISILSTAINATYNPWLMQRIKDREFNSISEVTKLISVFFAAGLIVFIILAPELVKIMASDKYYEAVYIIPPVAASTFFTLIYSYYCPFAQYFLKMKFLVFVNIGVAGLNVLLNYIFINAFGYLAAGYTTYICYLLYGWGTVFYVKKLINKEFGRTQVYDEIFLTIITVVLSFVMILINFLYDEYIFRYILLMVLLLVLYCKRKMLKNLVIKLRKQK